MCFCPKFEGLHTRGQSLNKKQETQVEPHIKGRHIDDVIGMAQGKKSTKLNHLAIIAEVKNKVQDI